MNLVRRFHSHAKWAVPKEVHLSGNPIDPKLYYSKAQRYQRWDLPPLYPCIGHIYPNPGGGAKKLCIEKAWQ